MLIVVSLFFSTMLAMDPTLKKQEKKSLVKAISRTIPHSKKKDQPVISIAWGDAKKKTKQLGQCFAYLPQEIIYPYFLIGSDPCVKNGLRKTNKTFSTLLSWEKKQPFMFCKELCASQDDLKAIIIQNVYPYHNNNDKLMPPNMKEIILTMGKKLENLSYAIGYTGNRSETLDLELALSDLSSSLTSDSEYAQYRLSHSLLLISGERESSVLSKEVSSRIPLLLISCITRNPYNVKYCLTQISFNFALGNNFERALHSVSKDDFERALHIIIKNDDNVSLRLLLDQKNRPSISLDLSSKLHQLVFFHASPNVTSPIINIYRENTIITQKCGALLEGGETDFLKMWLMLPNADQHDNVFSILKCHHGTLLKKHKNNQNYVKCLNIAFNKEALVQLDPPVEIMDLQKTKKGKNDIF